MSYFACGCKLLFGEYKYNLKRLTFDVELDYGIVEDQETVLER